MWIKKPQNNINSLVTYRKSLTSRLKRHNLFKIKLVSNKRSSITSYEKNLYGIRARNFFVRNVLIQLDNQPVIYAKTITQYKHSRYLISKLKNLKNRSLGSFVFNKSHYKRSDFRFQKTNSNNNLIKILNKENIDPKNIFITRLSFFDSSSNRILLIENFMKKINQYEL
jgi:chorismate-pyruvate lyase